MKTTEDATKPVYSCETTHTAIIKREGSDVKVNLDTGEC